MNLQTSELIRERAAGTQGAVALNVDIHTNEIDERAVITSCCVENGDAANTIATRIGVVRGGLLFPHKTNAAVAAGASLEIDREIILDAGETLRAELTPSGANTEWVVSALGVKIYLESTRT